MNFFIMRTLTQQSYVTFKYAQLPINSLMINIKTYMKSKNSNLLKIIAHI